jgi:hypothetical protein
MIWCVRMQAAQSNAGFRMIGIAQLHGMTSEHVSLHPDEAVAVRNVKPPEKPSFTRPSA